MTDALRGCVWIVWLRDFADARSGDAELTIPEIARVFVHHGLAEVLDAPPAGSRGKALLRGFRRRAAATQFPPEP